jgi:subtilisin-like proprotein convertase family protein
MRRVDSEGDSQSNRGRKRGDARPTSAQKPHLRRLALEALEERTLLSTAPRALATASTLPMPVTTQQSFVGGGITSNAANTSSPSVAVDPVDPQKLVAAWTTFDPGNKLDGGNGQVTTYVQGAYSIDGGKTWAELPNDLAADIQPDFSVAPPTNAPQPNFAQTTDATVAFGRDQTAYLLTTSHSGTGGVLDLQKWDFTTSLPAAGTWSAPAYDQLSGFNGDNTLNPIYRWQAADAAISPTLAVDNNVASFTQGTSTQTDAFAGHVYVAWETVDTAPKGVTVFNPNSIKLMASGDGGQNFTYQAYLDSPFNSGSRFDSPRIAISQGAPGVVGGQVTIVYEDSIPNNNVAPFFDDILTKADKTGGTDAHFDTARNVTIINAVKDGVASGVDAFTPTVIPIPVNIGAGSGFTSLQNLTVTISLQFAALNDTSATLTAPDGTTVTLWNNATNNAGQATNSPGTLTGANVGASTEGPFIGTVLDSTAFRSLFDGNVAAPYTGHFRPFANLQTAFAGRSAGALNGTWSLTITDFRNETDPTPPVPRRLVGASLDFTSGISDVTNGPASLVTTAFLNSGAHAFTEGIQAVPVLPNPSIASDNTLGANSPFQGRLYIALTNDDYVAPTGAYTTSTFIGLYTSDDGGSNWTYAGIVNDDNGLTDGFSTGGYTQPGSTLLASQVLGLTEFSGDPEANVRPKLEPQVAVDPYTGTLVVSYFDTRNDASAVRVANYIAASTDGGLSFAPQTYANPTDNGTELPVLNAINGAPVVLGPIPDNESGGSNNRESTFGFGQRQGLAVANGLIVPVWSSNQNSGSQLLNIKVPLNIESARVTYAAGPRVIASTQGPVGEPGDTVNTSRAADGSPIANTIVLTFDRGVDPATFQPDGALIGSSPIQVFYRDPAGNPTKDMAGNPVKGVPLRVLSVTPNDSSDTTYTVTFDPAGHGVGTYSYTLQPLVRGLIPYQTLLSNVHQVPFIDTAVNGGQASFSVSGTPGVPLTTATLSAQVDVYQKGVSTGSPTDLQVFLVAQDGTQYLLYSTSTRLFQAGTAVPVSSTIAIPAIPAELLDQTYTIRVVDNVPGEQVFVFNNVNTGDFNFQVLLDNQLAGTISGNQLDQDADGVPGEIPTDDYSVPNGRNSLPLIVSGPHVASTTVVGVKNVVGTGGDNLVNNDNVNTVTVNFDRDMQVSSFTPAQVLSVVGPTGRVDGPHAFPSTGTSKTYAFTGPAQLVPKSGTLASTILIANTGLRVSNVNVHVSITDPNDQNLKLTLVAPDGTQVPLVLAGTASGANFANTTFSDAPPANGLVATIPGGSAPYGLTYQPASPLGALSTHLLDGTWSLQITDSSAGGPPARLNSWSLDVTPRIPKGPGTELDSTLVISSFPDNSFTIAHLAVQLNISSTMDSGLQVFLVAPDGTTVIPLILNRGGNGANFANTILDDSSTLPIASGVAPFNLTYKPEGSLSSLVGRSLEGTWTLRIVHPTADASASTLNSWSLIATPQITVTPVNPANGAARSFAVGFPTQMLSGTYTVTLSPDILSVTPNPADPATGTPLDVNLNAGVDALRGVSSGPTSSDKFVATAVPVAIPYAAKPPIGPKVDGVLKSQINVTDNFPVAGDVGSLAGLIVSLNISYFNDPDLVATLTAPGPNGRTVTLFKNVGAGGNTANFSNTSLSDTTTPLAPITSGGAPFFGTFNPEGSLASFMTDTTGAVQFSQGLWTLTITNSGTDPGAIVDAQFPPSLLNWALDFQRPQPSTGLGEPVADRDTVSFRLFNIAPANPLANDTWTAVGPAGTTAAANPNNLVPGSANGANLAGPVSVVALDPADPTGGTAFVGASSGGVWKTTDFLTTRPGGPTYVPLTDFGPNYSINIGGIAIFDRNNDPAQSIIFAGTGDGQAATANAGNSVRGVGILRSTDGGASFTLLDSSVNVDAAGNPLPEDSPLRDHAFVGSTTYRMAVDPTPLPGGGDPGGRVIVYAALGGRNAGLWRSLDGGNHWQNLAPGLTATDVLLDPASASSSTGNIDIVYAAFQGVGVFTSSNRGQNLTEVFGTVGADNLIQNSLFAPALPLRVNNIKTPNGSFGRIVLAKPALTADAAQNILYQDWLYAAVENPDGTFNGLYITKDRGENWTQAQIKSIPDPGLNPTLALPTNDNLQANTYDFTSAKTFPTHNGNAAFSLTVDPLDPNIVYLGGTEDYQTAGLIRVDLTGLYDAHAYVPFADDRNDGGKLTLDSLGRVDATNIANGVPFFQGDNPQGIGTGFAYTSLRHSPTNPFNINSTQFVFNSTSFTNDGTGVKWQPLDTIYDSPLQGSTNVHQLFTIVDPLTGLTRLIVADDQGVFSGVFNADGSLNTSGIGTAATATGSLNGNLQDEELYYSAAQPSALAAQFARALFYGSGIGMTDVQSAPDLLSTGNLTWTVQGPAYGDLQNIILTNDRGGTGIATDPTGGTTITNPIGTGPSLYEYDVPFLGGDTTNFFRVNNAGQTTGLTNNYPVEFPGTNVPSGANNNGVTQLGNFKVNPLNGSQILISSNLGNVYETTNKGVQWLQIGSGSTNFDGTYAPALAYGAPDPNAPSGLGNLNNFIYVGTVGGHIYVTDSGGGPWTSISAGLDGSSVVSLYTNPNRLSHEAYAVTLKGVYYMADSLAPGATWANITGNLAQIQHSPFGDPTLAEASLQGYDAPSGQLGGFRSIVADYRYANPTIVPLASIPATGPAVATSTQATVTSSLNVSGNASNAYLVPGSGNAGTVTFNVTFATNSLANSPYTIRVVAPDGEATTLATGSITAAGASGGTATQTVSMTVPFTVAATRLVANGQYSLVVSNPGGVMVTINGWSASLGVQAISVHPVLYVAGYGGVFRSLDNGETWTLFPNTAFDSAPVDGGYLPSVDVTDLQLNLGAISPATGHATQMVGDPEVLLASTLGRGDFAIRLAPDVFPSTVSLDTSLPAPGGSDSGSVRGFPAFTNVAQPFVDGSSEISNFGNTVTVKIYDQANGILLGTGQTDPFGQFVHTDPVSGLLVPGIQLVNTGQDSSFFTVDGVKTIGIQATDSSGASGNITTFVYNLKQTPPPVPTNLTLVNDSGRFNNDDISKLIPPVFTVSTTEPGTTAVELFRFNPALPVGQQYELVDTENAVTPTTTLTDRLIVSELNGATINSQLTYFALQVDVANNPSTPLGNIGSDPTRLTITLDNILPATLNPPTLDPSTNSGLVPSQNITNNRNPLFDVVGLQAGNNLVLFRSIGGAAPILVGTAAPGISQVRDTTGVTVDGTYLYQVSQVDIAGNVSPLSNGLGVTINTQNPAAPTFLLFAADDSGAPSHPNVTNVVAPRFNGVGTPGLKLELVLFPNGIGNPGTVENTTTVAPNGTYLTQIPGTSPLADGTYIFAARITNAAGNSTLSAPITVTIKAMGPVIVPTLSILPADDTGVKGDGVTANHRPRFVGKTDPGDTVNLYAIVNGQLSAAQAPPVTASTINGSFTFTLPAFLTNGSTQLVAQATDIAGNKGKLTPVPLNVRIITVAGDYYDTGAAQIAIFDPNTESYFIRGGGSVSVDTTPGRDIPVQYDFNGDGATDFTAYRFNTAEYFGLVSTSSTIDFKYGLGNVSLPVSGTFGPSGTFIFANYGANSAFWVVNLPQPGGLAVKFVVPGLDIPEPAAYDGGGVTEIAAFRPSPSSPGALDADSFSVGGPRGYYQVSFTSPAVAKLGFVYKAGDIPAPADYDGTGHDEFAVYRPTTGQFFILKTPNSYDSSTWTMRTATLNLPGGPNAKDVPVSQDYDGNGRIDPSVYRPSNSTFYILHSSTGVQENIAYGLGNFDIAPAGPLTYRLSALRGPFASNGGFIGASGAGGTASAIQPAAGVGTLHASAITTATPTPSTVGSLIAVASPMPVATPSAPVAPTPAPAAPKLSVIVGASTPRAFVPTVAPTRPVEAARANLAKSAKAKKAARPLKVQSKAHAVEATPPVQHSKARPTPARHHAAVEAALQHIVAAKKAHHQG